MNGFEPPDSQQSAFGRPGPDQPDSELTTGSPIDRPSVGRVPTPIRGSDTVGRRSDRPPPTGDLGDSMLRLVDRLIGEVGGVSGAMVSSADGLVLTSRIPRRLGSDPQMLAAMSAAVLGLSNRLVQLAGPSPASFSHHRSDDGHVFVFGVSDVAVLTVLTDVTVELAQVELGGRRAAAALDRLLHAPEPNPAPHV